jgi:hypothetical protein
MLEAKWAIRRAVVVHDFMMHIPYSQTATHSGYRDRKIFSRTASDMNHPVLKIHAHLLPMSWVMSFCSVQMEIASK